MPQCKSLHHAPQQHLAVGLGDALELVLLADGVRLLRVGGRRGDQLIGEALGDGLDRAECGLASLSTQNIHENTDDE
jgi:hypothetical protein